MPKKSKVVIGATAICRGASVYGTEGYWFESSGVYWRLGQVRPGAGV